MRLDVTSPPVLLAAQLAERSLCREILLLQDDGAGTGSAGEVSKEASRSNTRPVQRITPAALTWPVWLQRRARRAVAMVNVDDLQGLAGTDGWDVVGSGIRRVVTAAPFSVVVSSDLPSDALASRLGRWGIETTFRGTFQHGSGAGSAVAVCEAPDSPHRPQTQRPTDFRVTAFLTVYNEEDVLDAVLDDLDAQGCSAYVLDNWSTDETWDIVQHHLGGTVIGAERWPAGGPARYFDLRASLERVTQLSRELGSDWYIKHDADELRRSPWPGVSLANGLWTAQCAGYNIIDFTVINYPPVDNGFARGADLWTHFSHFEFGRKPGHFRQFKAWRNFGQEVEYARFGSHRVAFPGARIFPYKFELHHYPIRSQSHGMRKVLTERQGRYLPAARKRGWHSHYDGISESTNFLVDPSTLFQRDKTTWDNLLVERLSGAGLPRDKTKRKT